MAPTTASVCLYVEKGDSENLSPVVAQCSVWLGKRKNKNSGVEHFKT